MEDTLHWIKGYKINVETMARELETNAERAYPDNNHLAKIIEKHLSLPEEKRIKKCVQTRQATKKRYTWDKTAQAWMDYIDTYQPVDQQGQWDAPPNIYNIPESIPENLDNQQFIIWLYSEFLKETHKAFTYEGNKLLCDLACGATIEYGNLEVLDREKLFERYKLIANNKIVCEQARVGMLALSQDAYLNEAYKRKKS